MTSSNKYFSGPSHDPDPGQSRALDHDRTEDDTLFILLSHTHILFKVICQLIRKCISFLRVSKKKQNCPTKKHFSRRIQTPYFAAIFSTDL